MKKKPPEVAIVEAPEVAPAAPNRGVLEPHTERRHVPYSDEQPFTPPFVADAYERYRLRIADVSSVPPPVFGQLQSHEREGWIAAIEHALVAFVNAATQEQKS